jgi:hypothetical protein
MNNVFLHLNVVKDLSISETARSFTTFRMTFAKLLQNSQIKSFLKFFKAFAIIKLHRLGINPLKYPFGKREIISRNCKKQYRKRRLWEV